jgi:hypothetical protein
MRPGLAIAAGVLMASALAGCATQPVAKATTQPAVAVEPLTIRRVGVEPKTIHVDTGQAAMISYELSRAAEVRIDVVDDEGRVIRPLDAVWQAKGMHTARWDGQTAQGEPAPSGVYRYVIQAQAQDGQHAVYDPSRDTGGEELQPREFVFDRQTGALRWVMPKAGRARLRIGLEGFPHLRTLLDWEPLEAGQRQIVWDGLDASGQVRLMTHPALLIKLSVFALADNTIIVHSEASMSGLPSDPMYPSHRKGEGAYFHARHPRPNCHEPRIDVEFPDGTRYDAEARPVLTGTVPVRVVADPRDAPALVNARFEVALFEDLAILFEEEEASNPFTFLWDTTRLPPGPHLLTVNVLSYDDHYGVVTQPVIIERAR